MNWIRSFNYTLSIVFPAGVNQETSSMRKIEYELIDRMPSKALNERETCTLSFRLEHSPLYWLKRMPQVHTIRPFPNHASILPDNSLESNLPYPYNLDLESGRTWHASGKKRNRSFHPIVVR
jgi:hypothetical protein